MGWRGVLDMIVMMVYLGFILHNKLGIFRNHSHVQRIWVLSRDKPR